jgi:hypothetical protein
MEIIEIAKVPSKRRYILSLQECAKISRAAWAARPVATPKAPQVKRSTLETAKRLSALSKEIVALEKAAKADPDGEAARRLGKYDTFLGGLVSQEDFYTFNSATD